MVWKRALKADYDECMEYSDDCNDDHLDNYKSDLAQWIIYFIFAVLLAFFNCCVGRNLFIYRIAQASHNEILFRNASAVRPFAAVEPDVIVVQPSQPPPPMSFLSDQDNNTRNTIEMVKIESDEPPDETQSQPQPPVELKPQPPQPQQQQQSQVAQTPQQPNSTAIPNQNNHQSIDIKEEKKEETLVIPTTVTQSERV